MLGFLGKICFKITGWEFEGKLPDHKKYVMIVAHHTSNWDGVISLMSRSVLKVHGHWYGKDSMFRGPKGKLFRALGGLPIDRSQSKNIVQTAIDAFHSHDEFILCIAPEGTRKKVEGFKTGFYHIAVGANVPIVPVGLDFARKKVVLFDPMELSGDLEKDLPGIYRVFANIKAKNPEYVCEKCLE